jgi:hypothetical protein
MAGPHDVLPPHRQTHARQFHECRWSYRAEHIWKVPMADPPHFKFGRLVHEVIQQYIDHLIATSQPYAPQDMDEIWLTFLASCTEPVPEERRTEMRKVLRRFSMDFRLDVDAVWKPEASLAVDIDRKPVPYDHPSALVRGTLDLPLVRGASGFVMDWKTAWAPMSETAMRTHLQPRTYAMLFNAWNPRVQFVEVTYWFVRFGVARTVVFGLSDFKQTWEEWLAIAEGIYATLAESDNDALWTPTPGPHCGNCGVAVQCPIGLPALGNIAALTQASAEEKGRIVMAAEAGLKVLKEQLKVRVKAQGPVDVDGQRFAFRPSGTKWLNPARIAAIAEKFFIEPFSFLTVDGTALKRIGAKERGFLAALLAENLATDRGVTFAHRPIAGNEMDGMAPELDEVEEVAEADPVEG